MRTRLFIFLTTIILVFSNSISATAEPAGNVAVVWGLLSGPGPDATDLVQVEAGMATTYGLYSDGTVNVWGTDKPPFDLTNVVQIDTFGPSALAVTDSGQVIGWGLFFQDNTIPTASGDIAQAALGTDTVVVLHTDGTVETWGDPGSAPTGLDGVVQVAAGDGTGVALRNDGTVVAWGSPTIVAEAQQLHDVIQVAAGYQFVVAALRDDSVTVLGNPLSGENEIPRGLHDVIQVAAEQDHVLALQSDGTVVGWGGNRQLEITVPPDLKNVTQISTSTTHSVALVKTPPAKAQITFENQTFTPVQIPTTLKATSNSTAPITFSVADGPCTITDGELSGRDDAVCTITAQIGATSGLAPATSTATITIATPPADPWVPPVRPVSPWLIAGVLGAAAWLAILLRRLRRLAQPR